MYRNTLTTITAVLTLTINLVFSQVVINEIHYNPASSQGSDNDYEFLELYNPCLLYTSPSPRDRQKSRMPSSA